MNLPAYKGTLRDYKGYLFDLDGVLWRGAEVIPGAVFAVNALKSMKRRVVFVTNNASAHRATHLAKLQAMGFQATLDEVVTSGYATARYISERFSGSRVHVMGTEELAREMADHGHEVVDEQADLVVVGLDRMFTYEKLDLAFRVLRESNALFVACNDNPVLPLEDGFHPGVGAAVQALACCIGRQPDIIVGKPHRPMMDITLEAVGGLPPDECLMVGDVLEHDIIWANECGMDTVYVLSGVGTEDDIEKKKIFPTHVLLSVADLPLPGTSKLNRQRH